MREGENNDGTLGQIYFKGKTLRESYVWFHYENIKEKEV